MTVRATDNQYQPKVNEKRYVVGTLPGGLTYALRPPTNRDLIAIEHLALETSSNVEKQLKVICQLSEPQIGYDTLLDADAESMEVLGKALELFSVFRNRPQ